MLGMLAAKYASNTDPGAISVGMGNSSGTLYGAYQFAACAGVPLEFILWLGRNEYPYADSLMEAVPGTALFNRRWCQVAAVDPVGFLAMQEHYAKQVFYEPAIFFLEANAYHANLHEEALRQVIFSAAVQYGSFYVPELFFTACVRLGYASLACVDTPEADRAMIEAVYTERSLEAWMGDHQTERKRLRKRFAAECREAVDMLSGKLRYLAYSDN